MEYLFDIQKRYPAFNPCGQGSFQGEGDDAHHEREFVEIEECEEVGDPENEDNTRVSGPNITTTTSAYDHVQIPSQ